MADDIDIEEHDVLNDPAIRSIFPDITIIKKEISQYYEDAPNIELEQDSLVTSSAKEINFKNDHTKSQNLLPSKDIVTNYEILNLEKTPVAGNKIILGSKPNNTLQHIEKEGEIIDIHLPVHSVNPVPKIILQDLGAYIYNNNRYCKDCQTLFSSRFDCADHNRKVHFIKTRNKKMNVKVTLEQNNNKCNVCDSRFSNSSNLIRHHRNIHKKKSLKREVKSNRIVMRTRKLSHVASRSISRGTSNSLSQVVSDHQTRPPSKNINQTTKNVCFHCKKIFSDYKSLIEHIYEVLEPKHATKKKTTKKRNSVEENHETNNEKPVNSTICENINKFVSKSFRDKLKFENEDSDESEYQVSNTKRDIIVSETKTKRRDNVTIVPTSQELKEKLDQKEINDENQVEVAFNSKALRIKRKHQNQYDSNKLMETNEIFSPGPKSLNKKQKHEIRQLDSNELPRSHDGLGSSFGDLKIKNQDSPESDLSTKQNLNMKAIPTKEKKHLLPLTSENESVEEALKPYESDTNILIYECKYCSFVLSTVKEYNMHVVRKHKANNILNATRVIFDEQCKFCTSKCKTDNDRNTHIYSDHRDLLNRHVPEEFSERANKNTKLRITSKMLNSFVLKSIIFKCNECDIHFLSSCTAKDHEKHMKGSKNWRCFICRRMFKERDRHLHLKQHKFSKTFKIYQFNELGLSRLLYNCTKCAIHFTEKRYSEHYSKCGSEIFDSKYCKTCDILIDKREYTNHETFHRTETKTDEFTIILSDLITIPKRNCKHIGNVKKRKKLHELVNSLTFCQTCKCCLNDTGYTHTIHYEALCSNIKKIVCNFCGLVLSVKSADSHRKYHKQKKLKLKDFMFFDLKGTQINPPIPEYPICYICEVYFLSKRAVSSHICSEIEYFICHICNIKLSENAYKLHMDFHNYCQVKASNDTLQAVVASELSQQKRDTNESKIMVFPSSNTAIDCEHKNIITVDDKLDNTDNPINKIAYSCHYCKIAIITYDKVIEHCQNHFSPTPIPTKYCALKICSKCSLKFESDASEIHHVQCDNTQWLTFDPTYFTSDNSKWLQHIFSSVPQTVQKEIVNKSIYLHERRVKMEVLQKGPIHLTVYKCSQCGNFIDSDSLFTHIKNTCSKYVRKYPCSVCGLPFTADDFRSKHEKIHIQYKSARLKSYNIVLIKCEAHNSCNTSIINAIGRYILYQCRACDGIVDKLQRHVHQCNLDDLQKCHICHLLLYKDEYERHIFKHTDLAMFNNENIKVILFGNKVESNLEKVLSPSFIGVVHDYKLYKCAKCDVCVNNENSIAKHVCTFDSKWKCPKCNFYICASLSLKKHIRMHDVDSEFKNENIKVEIFAKNDLNTNINTQIYPTHGKNSSSKESDQEEGCKHANTELETVRLYKCFCGLHYIDKLNANNHVKHCVPSKAIRQMCSKCSLVFNQKELFSHIIAHHGDKNKTYRFEVTEISIENKNMS